MISPSTVDDLLMLRACYVKPPSESHLIEKMKLINCHILMRIRRKIIRSYFERLKKSTSSFTESKSHIGIVKYYDSFERRGIITSNNQDFWFEPSDVNDKFLRHFIKKGEPVLFWGNRCLARGISTLFGDKFKKLGRITFYGQVYKKRVYFQVYNETYSLYMPNSCFRNNDIIEFYLKSKNGLLFVIQAKRL